jgi:hypothetical protein
LKQRFGIGEQAMSENEKEAVKRRGLSLDTWAVLAALFAALLIRTGVLKHIPW